MFETKVHDNILLGILKRLPPRLILFVNTALHGFNARGAPNPSNARSLQFVLALAHALEIAHVC